MSEELKAKNTEELRKSIANFIPGETDTWHQITEAFLDIADYLDDLAIPLDKPKEEIDYQTRESGIWEQVNKDHYNWVRESRPEDCRIGSGEPKEEGDKSMNDKMDEIILNLMDENEPKEELKPEDFQSRSKGCFYKKDFKGWEVEYDDRSDELWFGKGSLVTTVTNVADLPEACDIVNKELGE